MSEYMPELNELQQMEEDDYDTPPIVVPVRICEIEDGPLAVHVLPSRHAVMRNVTVTPNVVQQLVGYDLRRKTLKIWGDAAANGVMYLGSDKSEVEQSTCARWPVQINTGANGVAPVLEMGHCEAVWVKSDQAVNVSYIAEYWAD
jgi:hypothetical protein